MRPHNNKTLNIDNKKYFNEKYFNDKRFNRGKNNSLYDVVYFNLVRDLLKANSKILEIGCSHGNLLSLLETKYETFGIDISSFAIKKASGNLRKTKLKKSDFETKNVFLKEKFDCILGIDVFEHFKNIKKTMKKCYKMLNKGGFLIIKVPNKNSITLKFLKLFNLEERWVGYCDPTHHSILELDEWVNMFNELKFNVKVMASPPSNLLKKITKNNTALFFNKFNKKNLNESITLVGKK